MKITMLTESLGSGGAERQMCSLAVEMKRRGHDVQVITYFPDNFYLSLLEHAGVKHTFLGGNSTRQWLPRIRRLLRTNHQEVVLAFLESCASYAEIAALPFRRWGLIVSERIAVPNVLSHWEKFRKSFHLLADAVVTNSHTNRLMLEAAVPALKSRMVTIYNAVDLDRFRPTRMNSEGCPLRLLVAARFNKQKNVLGAIEAMNLLRRRCKEIGVSVDWFGNSADDPQLWRECMALIRQHKLEQSFRLHEVTQDIISHYQQVDAIFLPSLYEGLPNTVCEAMACGKPVLMSAVCDAGNLVKEGENGFLFSPHDPSDIAEAIRKFASLTEAERRAMGQRSREMARKYFDLKKIADMYESILFTASQRQPPECGHWVPEVPRTALDYDKLATVK